MRQPAHPIERPRTPTSVVTTERSCSEHGALSGLSVRELIAELAQVEDALDVGTVLIAHPEAPGVGRGRRELVHRADAIVGELAVRRRRRDVTLPG